MTKSDQQNIIGCLETIASLAGKSTSDHRTLAINTMVILKALNSLFEKEGLETVESLFTSQD
jgi:hypothetical protein